MKFKAGIIVLIVGLVVVAVVSTKNSSNEREKAQKLEQIVRDNENLKVAREYFNLFCDDRKATRGNYGAVSDVATDLESGERIRIIVSWRSIEHDAYSLVNKHIHFKDSALANISLSAQSGDKIDLWRVETYPSSGREVLGFVANLRNRQIIVLNATSENQKLTQN